MTTFSAKIIDGKLSLGSEFNEARFREWCKLNEGKVVRIEKEVSIRSLTQNALYWAWLKKCELETGNDANYLHEYLKATQLPMRLIKIRGKNSYHEVRVVGSTTGLKKNEFSEYLEKCAAHLEIPLPSPEEILAMGYIRPQYEGRQALTPIRQRLAPPERMKI